jgi:hypothetical protein
VRILESLEHVMRWRTIKYVRDLWTNQTEREATWELEEQMRKKYPKLFEDGELYHLYFVFLFFGLCRRST